MVIIPNADKIRKILNYIVLLDDEYRYSNPDSIKNIACLSCDKNMVRHSSSTVGFDGFDCKECKISTIDFCIEKTFTLNEEEFYHIIWEFADINDIKIYFYNNKNSPICYLKSFIPFNVSIDDFKKILLLS